MCGRSRSARRDRHRLRHPFAVSDHARHPHAGTSLESRVEAGFRRNDPTLRAGQLAEALIRLARFIVSIRLHVEDWSVEQGVRFFRDECFMEESGARREAERGTFDPTYLVYSVGKLMLLKLKRN